MRDFWDRHAPTFDQEPDHGLLSPEVRAAWAAVLLPLMPAGPASVVDLGCGTGSLSVLLAQAGHEVLGVDLSPRMVAAAQAKANAAGVPAVFVEGDTSQPPCAPASCVPGAATGRPGADRGFPAGGADARRRRLPSGADGASQLVPPVRSSGQARLIPVCDTIASVLSKLGELERAAMEVLWDSHSPVLVRDVVRALAERDLAYTTVMTVLTRLTSKGFVQREADGRAWRYSPVASREEYIAQLMLDALSLTGDREAALTHFARSVSSPEAEVLSQALADKQDET